MARDATVTISFRVSAAKADALERLSQSIDRPKSWLLERALEQYLLDQAWQIEAIEAGVKAADAGDVVHHECVREWLISWGKEDESEPPA